jgi:Ser/Thr protein kinase RdoA (MazF antagonist)
MMNIQIMRYVVDVLQSGATPQVAQTATAHWNGRSLNYVRSSANHIFRFSQDNQPRYLRLAHSTERSHDAIQAELDFVLHAANSGLSVARPIPSANGAFIEVVHEDDQAYFAVVFEALQGTQFEADDLDQPMLHAWGRR